MIIKTTAWKDGGWASQENPVYENRKSWVVSLPSRKYKYVLSVANTIVVEVFEVESWHET